MAIYGYVRTSTKHQNPQRQINNIMKDFPNALLILEAFTGTKLDRPEWTKLYKKIKQGDTIVFDEVSRMSRNAEEGFSLYKELFQKDINLVFLKEPHISTDTYKQALSQQINISIDTGKESTDRLMTSVIEALNVFLLDLVREQIKLAFIQAQKEVDYLHQRTKEGIAVARANGKQIGQKEGATFVTKKSYSAKQIIKKHNKDFGGSLTNEETWKLAGISKMTFYKYKKELMNEI